MAGTSRLTNFTPSTGALYVLKLLAEAPADMCMARPEDKGWNEAFKELVDHGLADEVGDDHAMISDDGRRFLGQKVT